MEELTDDALRLKYPEVREGVKKFSDWPTIPQLYVSFPQTQCEASQRFWRFSTKDAHMMFDVGVNRFIEVNIMMNMNVSINLYRHMK